MAVDLIAARLHKYGAVENLLIGWRAGAGSERMHLT